MKHNTLIILVIKKLYGGLKYKTVTYNPSNPIYIYIYGIPLIQISMHDGLMKTISAESVLFFTHG
jgi:hypothetical protein